MIYRFKECESCEHKEVCDFNPDAYSEEAKWHLDMGIISCKDMRGQDND